MSFLDDLKKIAVKLGLGAADTILSYHKDAWGLYFDSTKNLNGNPPSIPSTRDESVSLLDMSKALSFYLYGKESRPDQPYDWIRDEIARKRFGTAVQRITLDGGGKTVSAVRCEAC